MAPGRWGIDTLPKFPCRWHAGGFPAGRRPERVTEQRPREAELPFAAALDVAISGEGRWPLCAQDHPTRLGRRAAWPSHTARRQRAALRRHKSILSKTY